MDTSLDPERFNVFVAHTKKKRIYACESGIPWTGKVNGDLKILRKLTIFKKNSLIMGRLTHEFIGRPLPGRVNVVVGSQVQEKEGIVAKKTFQEAVQYCRDSGSQFLEKCLVITLQ